MGREKAGILVNFQDQGAEDGEADSVLGRGIRDFLEYETVGWALEVSVTQTEESPTSGVFPSVNRGQGYCGHPGPKVTFRLSPCLLVSGKSPRTHEDTLEISLRVPQARSSCLWDPGPWWLARVGAPQSLV